MQTPAASVVSSSVITAGRCGSDGTDGGGSVSGLGRSHESSGSEWGTIVQWSGDACGGDVTKSVCVTGNTPRLMRNTFCAAWGGCSGGGGSDTSVRSARKRMLSVEQAETPVD